MRFLAYLLYLAIALLQITATASGLQHLTGLWWLLCWFGALLVGWIPVIGTALGIYGAYVDWQWNFWLAVGLFFGIPLIVLLISMVVGTVSRALERRRFGT